MDGKQDGRRCDRRGPHLAAGAANRRVEDQRRRDAEQVLDRDRELDLGGDQVRRAEEDRVARLANRVGEQLAVRHADVDEERRGS